MISSDQIEREGNKTHHSREYRPCELTARLSFVEGRITAEAGELLGDLQVRPTRAEETVITRITRPRVEHRRLYRLSSCLPHAERYK